MEARRAGFPLVALTFVLAAGAVAYGYRAWSAARRERIGRLLGELAMCLSGPARPPDAEARIVARRWLAHHGRPGRDCAPAAQALADAKSLPGLARGAPDLASTLASELGRDEVTETWGQLLEATAALPFLPPAGAAPSPASEPPSPILDRDLDELRAAWPSWIVVDAREPGSLRLGLLKERAVELGDGPEGALSSSRWVPTPFPLRPTFRLYVEGGRAVAQGWSPPETKEDLGEATSTSIHGRWILIERGRELIARRWLEELRFGPEHHLTLPPGEPGRLTFRSCAHPRGTMIAIAGPTFVGAVLATEASAHVWPWRSVVAVDTPASRSVVRPTCHEGGARLAWVSTTPAGPVQSDPRGHDVPPPGPHSFHVETLRCEVAPGCEGEACTRSPCTHAEETVLGLSDHWQSVGGWSSPLRLVAPDLVDLGDALAVVTSGGSLHVRVGALGRLASAPERMLVEVARTQEAARDPRALGFYGVELHPWGDAAILTIDEQMPKPAALVVRVDARGGIAPLRPPP